MKKIESYLNEYFSNNKYFSSLEELYMLFEQESIPLKDRKEILKQIYSHNMKIQKTEQKKKEKTIDTNSIKFDNSEYKIIGQKEENKNVQALKFDISSYMTDIRNAKTLQQLDNILPKKDAVDFDNILSAIIIELYKEKVYIINSIHSHDEKDLEIKQFFEEELEDIDFKIEYLLEYKEYEEYEEVNVSSQNNKIIFLKNSYNEPIIFQNLKGYEEYYSSFLELITSIQSGRFKKVKGFVKENKISDISEVKSFKTRILFAKIKEDTYVVLAAFVKKCDWDLRHRNFVGNISQKYQMQKNELLNNLQSQKFIDSEQTHLYNLLEMLKEKKKVRNHEIN